jgi:hypothetical protein
MQCGEQLGVTGSEEKEKKEKGDGGEGKYLHDSKGR